MALINVMEDSILIEGIMASIMFPLSRFFLKYTKGGNLFWFLFAAWLFSWYMRKLSVALYKYIQEKYKIPKKHLTINIPFI